MKPSADSLLLCLIAALTAMTAGVIALQSYEPNSSSTVGREFQSALVGLGMGCQIDLSRCTWQFDPRAAGHDDPGLDSVPCLSELSPWHSMALFPAGSDDAPVEGD